ncbi:hypothetical protein QWY82_02455 [Simiduia curdlanivorans]|uniref:Uncharacterized protein n=1 Tax=Simiduia curdlanivorans TaxID=1492769 RepID=A0ABV8V0S5_9GAMM|nr:hypothetical protein [Simiduia curdlanivorans]MDN3637660.1 hypothetical protein [Simiduia curdlanivorans]
MKGFQLNLVESEIKIILEALTEMEKRMSDICESSKDEDEIADVGNDLIEVRLLLKPLKERAVEQFGANIVNFSRELL